MNMIFQPSLVSLIETNIANSWVGVKGPNLIQFRDSSGNEFQIKEAMIIENMGYLECIRISDGVKMSPEPTGIHSGDDSSLEKYVQQVAKFVATSDQP